MKIDISIGEVIDRLSILQIKKEKIIDQNKLKNVIYEYDLLSTGIDNSIKNKFYDLLYTTNLKLWEVEDKIRIKEKNKNFDKEFIELARSVYYLNDARARIKKDINIEYNSSIVEEKSYEEYENDQ